MSLKAYVPFTTARQRRLMLKGLQKQLGDHEALLQIEYPDGSEQFKPASWDSASNSWQTDDGERFYSVGFGASPNSLWGVPVVHVDATNAGVVSSEAAKVANREENLDFVDADGDPLEVIEENSEGGPETVSYEESGEELAADGGEVNLHYDMNAPEGYDGEVIDRRLAGFFDPFPVSRQEADQAVKMAETAGMEEGERIRAVLLGLGIGVGIIMLMLILFWLMGQIGGSDGGNVIPMVLWMIGGGM